MEVVAATPNNGTVPPFHNHDVREWSRIDSLTGVLERARLETDHWTANTTNSSHKYGKVVDSRARSGADGNLKQEAKRQLEVFQSQIPGGRLQVIKTHTVSSSRWTNRSSTALESRDLAQDFEDLQLSVNPLDLSSEKSKASVGRSVGRRPPSRQRIRDESSENQQNLPPTKNIHGTAATNLHRVSRLCHQIHDNAVKQTFGKYYHQRSSIQERQNGDGSVEITEIESDTDKTKRINGHTNLTRTKSTSSEDLHLIIPERDKSTKSIEDLEDLEQLQSWRRTSKLRRSLQFPKQNKAAPKPSDLPENSGSVRKIREDLEKGRRLTTALRGNNVDLEALDQILQSISTTQSTGYSDKTPNNIIDKYEEPEKDQVFTNKLKRNSFVTVESIQEVRGRLRRTSSPSSDIYKDNKEETDDGIVTGDSNLNLKQLTDMPVTDGVQSRVRSYVYGMENTLNKKTISGTGSLESRSKQLNGNSVNRNEDWYNRRKSYGFEKVHNQHEDMISSKSKNTVESSTDSGICRSSEIVVIPTAAKKDEDIYKTNEFSSDSDSEIKRVFSKSNSLLNMGNVKKYSSIFESKENSDDSWSRHDLDTNWMSSKKEIEGTTITIPIVAKTSPVFSTRKIFERELGDGSSYSIETWQNSDDNESKKMDGAKNSRKTSLAINTNDLYLENEDETNYLGRKTKKVEFCKTEVHFAADSGRVNIVETDEKPPPTNNFRRRRRNSGLIPHTEDFNSNGLPVFQFGDSSFDKNLFGISDAENGDANDEEYENLQNMTFGTVTVNTSANISYQDYEEDLKDNADNEIPKGILKNKPPKPKPYILGDSDNYLQTTDTDQESKPWGIKLRSVKDETPIWRSTVTVRNTFYDNQNDGENYPTESSHCESYPRDQDVRESQPEFQKMLKTLRPTRKRPESFNEGESFNGIRIVSPPVDARRSSWSVADRVKQVEELQWVENKGYSTKVNFGNGEATVIENSKQTTDRHPTWPRREETSSDLARIQTALETEPPKPPSHTQYENDLTSKTDSNNIYRSKVSTRAKYSPVVLRKSYPARNPNSLRTTFDPEKLSSPSLVGLNRIKNESRMEDVKIEVETKSFVEKSNKGSLERKTQAKSVQNRSPNRVRTKSPSKEVLRQPRKSEMAYFGVPNSPKSTRKVTNKQESRLTEKPDLLQFNNADFKQTNKQNEIATKNVEPIYENIEEIKKHKTKYGVKRELDSSILEELTKAADQILQAVNGYTDEDSQNKFSTDDEDKKLNYKREPLDTISETKSWKQDKNSPPVKSLQNRNSTSTRTKLKHTSSTSSVESVSRECRRVTSSVRKTPSTPPSAVQKPKKKTTNGDNASAKANTKARRLQRASSREALLQSHGSSSEDLPANVEVPLRKPRLVRKTKTTQLSVTSCIEMNKKVAPGKKREDPVKGKIDERIPSVGLPEIRHKTAVSTIRSTAEKAASRDRISKSKNEDLKKKAALKRETRGTSSSSRTEKVRSTSSREIANHRISTANIKKCSRSEGLMKH